MCGEGGGELQLVCSRPTMSNMASDSKARFSSNVKYRAVIRYLY